MSSRKTIKSAIESMMFIWGEPLDVKDIADVFNIDKKEAYECCRELMEEYEQEGRGILIREVNKAFQFTTRPGNLPYIERLCTPTRHRRLSQSALETREIESIRGIRCDRVMEGLVRKGLVREMGRSETVGRPILYGTTDEFLKQFGFETIKDLPEIQNIEGLLEEDEAGLDVQDSVSLQQISLEDLAGEPSASSPEGEASAEVAPEAEVSPEAGASPGPELAEVSPGPASPESTESAPEQDPQN